MQKKMITNSRGSGAAFVLASRALITVLALLLVQCGNGERPEGADGSGEKLEFGELELSLAFPPDPIHDVAGVRFVATDEAGDSQTETVTLDDQGLPSSVDPDLAGHRFADWLVVLSPGTYRVTATPVDEEGSPSLVCGEVTGTATVEEGQTVELLLVSECDAGGSGGLDALVAFNSPPFIEELVFQNAGGNGTVCPDEAAEMVVAASDPDGDDLSYQWEVTGLPSDADAASFCLLYDGAAAGFSAVVPGDYELRVRVSDTRQEASLTFRVRVNDQCDGVSICPGQPLTFPPSPPPGNVAGRCDCDIDEALFREVTAALDENVERTRVDANAVFTHEILPESIRGATAFGERELVEEEWRLSEVIDEGIVDELSLVPELAEEQLAEQIFWQPGLFEPPVLTKLPDIGGFGLDLFNEISADCNGYVVLVAQNSQIIHVGQWNWARNPVDGGEGWLPSRRMHMASVSKLLTAMGMLKVLDENSIDPNTSISNFLPAYWPQGPNIGSVTFTHLLQNRSGFNTGGATDYTTMRQAVASGLSSSAVGNGGYQNMNFGLMRILMPIIDGRVNRFAMVNQPGLLRDVFWDIVTVSAYRDYMNENVFNPSGVYGASLINADAPNHALAYANPYTGGNGWSSGNLRSVAGGAGWVMSAEMVLKVMSTFRHSGTILSTTRADWFLNMGFGIDRINPSDAGQMYEKNGRWTRGGGATRESEQAVAVFLPHDMEVVVFVNSDIGNDPNRRSLRNLVRDLYRDNL